MLINLLNRAQFYIHCPLLVLKKPFVCLDCSSLKNPQQVERLQEKAHRALKRYVENKYPSSPERFAKILLRLPATRMLTKRAAEELFFSPLIGAVRIESIMNSIISSSLAM